MPAELVLPEVVKLLAARPVLRWVHPLRFAGTPGCPDFVVVGPRGAIWREVKPTRHSPLRPGQTAWRYALVAASQNWAVWSQEGLDDGSIEAELDMVEWGHERP